MLASKSRCALLRSVFRGWVGLVEDAKTSVDVLAHLASRICQRTVADYFHALRSHVQMQKRVRKASSLIPFSKLGGLRTRKTCVVGRVKLRNMLLCVVDFARFDFI